MGCYKIENDVAHFVCVCGFDYSLSLEDLTANRLCIPLPPCTECGAISTLHVAELPEGAATDPTISRQVFLRHKINQSLHKKLFDAGRKSDELVELGVVGATHRFASGEALVEAPLNLSIAQAKAAREAE